MTNLIWCLASVLDLPTALQRVGFQLFQLPGHSAKTSTQLIRSRAAYKLSARPEQRLLFLGQLFQLRELYWLGWGRNKKSGLLRCSSCSLNKQLIISKKLNGFFANWMIQYDRSTQFQMIRQSSIHSIPDFFFSQINEVPWCNWGPGSCVQVHWLFSSSNRSGRRKSARFLGHPSKTFFHLLSRWLSHNIRHIRTNSIIFASTAVLDLPLLNLISINLLPMFRDFTSNSLYLMVINYYCMYMFSIWQCVKTNSTPVVHIKIAGLKWMFIPLKMVFS